MLPPTLPPLLLQHRHPQQRHHHHLNRPRTHSLPLPTPTRSSLTLAHMRQRSVSARAWPLCLAHVGASLSPPLSTSATRSTSWQSWVRENLPMGLFLFSSFKSDKAGQGLREVFSFVQLTKHKLIREIDHRAAQQKTKENNASLLLTSTNIRSLFFSFSFSFFPRPRSLY